MQRSFHIPEQIEILITDYLNGVISEEELIELNSWISESNENEQCFNTLKSAWIAGGKTSGNFSTRQEDALSSVKQRFIRNKTKTFKSFRNFYGIAASWLIIFILTGALSIYFTSKCLSGEKEDTCISVSAPLGAKSYIDLPDGTSVWLNAGSKITFNNADYGISSREVHLTGEAYFSVKTNKMVPFLVRTSDLLVKALGTKFNVKAYPEEKTITAILEEGKIEVTPLNGSSSTEKVMLVPNEMVTYNIDDKKYQEAGKEKEKPISPPPAKTKSTLKVIPHIKSKVITSWKDEDWIIDGQCLDELVPLLERRYNMEIKFSSDKIKKFKFTGKIRKETIEQIMNALEMSAPIKYKIQGNQIILSVDKKRLDEFNKYTGE
jgi:ferric-dicitrate binding protein FerR (iron transport regulator)